MTRASYALLLCLAWSMVWSRSASADIVEQTIDIPIRQGVTQRFLYLAAPNAKAAAILFTGGQGELQLAPDGTMKTGKKNFLVRNQQRFAENGLSVAVVDAPSDRQAFPFLAGFRETFEHVADIKAVIAGLRTKSDIPLWLVGTSRGTQSAAFIASQLAGAQNGIDGLMLTSTVLQDRSSRAVPEMNVDRILVPVLVVHHEQDGCKVCLYWQVSRLMRNLRGASNKELITITGGEDRGDPCEPLAHHGFNGQDADLVGKIAGWITSH